MSFKTYFQVRDYECDIAKIVNNANYFHYFEHARHEYLKSIGLSYAELYQKDVNLVLVKAEIEYKNALKSGDQFYSTVEMQQVSSIRFCFKQEIYLLPDNKLTTKGNFTGVAVSVKNNKILESSIWYNQ
ncbi:MAG: thioesterase family protein [Candidatus Margulisiibacteriota bacterium]|jgi:acyl-CoA thioester hydrolase